MSKERRGIQEILVQIELEHPAGGRIADSDEPFVIDEVIHDERAARWSLVL